ncbi:TetR/AcrR family transcriptional regulator [Streptomyces sp. NPDC006879]|uniref:TetR/AcrR family transcriptional regulator n=1 Tax=Streptomyces sp. NPDC006879 TaxID=3364767 RepID=UPI0036833BB1
MSTPDRRTLIADAAITTVAGAGLRGLTHRAVDTAAQLPAGSTSYYFRTRTALIEACYHRLAQADLADLAALWGDDAAGPPHPAPASLDAAAGTLARVLHHWLTDGRARQLARFELSLEAVRRPELQGALHRAGHDARTRAAALLAQLGATHPEEAAELLTAWTDGLLYDRLAGALASTRPEPDRAELTRVVRRMITTALEP